MRKSFETKTDREAKLFDYALALIGLLFLIFGLKKFSFVLGDLMATIFLLVAVCLLEFFQFQLSDKDELFFTLGCINSREGLLFAAVMLVQWHWLPYANAMVALVFGVLFGRLIRAVDLAKGLLSEVTSVPVIFYFSLAVFAFFDQRFGENLHGPGGNVPLLKLLPIILGGVFFIVLRIWLDGTRISFQTCTPARWFWKESARLRIPSSLAFVSIGVLAVFSYQTLLYQDKFPFSIVLATLLLLGLLYLCRLNTNIKEAYQDAVKTLAGAVEIQKPEAVGHGQRVAGYALAIARELDVHGRKYEGLGLAALVHDIGRVGINEDSLDAVLESAAASEGEYLHAQLGAEIISQVSFLQADAEAIKLHHKPFSSHKASVREAGTIPQSARIINVADLFDQLVEVRPMEERLSPEEAVNRLKKESGLLLDPKIVRVFMALLRKKGFLTEGGLRRRR